MGYVPAGGWPGGVSYDVDVRSWDSASRYSIIAPPSFPEFVGRVRFAFGLEAGVDIKLRYYTGVKDLRRNRLDEKSYVDTIPNIAGCRVVLWVTTEDHRASPKPDDGDDGRWTP